MPESFQDYPVPKKGATPSFRDHPVPVPAAGAAFSDHLPPLNPLALPASLPGGGAAMSAAPRTQPTALQRLGGFLSEAGHDAMGLLTRAGDVVRGAEAGFGPAFGQAKAQQAELERRLLQAHRTGKLPLLHDVPTVEPLGRTLGRAAKGAYRAAVAPLGAPSPLPPGGNAGLLADLILNPGDWLTGGVVAKGARVLRAVPAIAHATLPLEQAVTKGVEALKGRAAPVIERAAATKAGQVASGLANRYGVSEDARKFAELASRANARSASQVDEIAQIAGEIGNRQIELRESGPIRESGLKGVPPVPEGEYHAQGFNVTKKTGRAPAAAERQRLKMNADPLRQGEQTTRARTPAEDALLKSYALTGEGEGPLQSAVKDYVLKRMELQAHPSPAEHLGELKAAEEAARQAVIDRYGQFSEHVPKIEGWADRLQAARQKLLAARTDYDQLFTGGKTLKRAPGDTERLPKRNLLAASKRVKEAQASVAWHEKQLAQAKQPFADLQVGEPRRPQAGSSHPPIAVAAPAGDGIERYQYLRNAEGGQAIGTQYEIRPLTEEVFQREIRPALKQIEHGPTRDVPTLKEWLERHPTRTHYRVYRTERSGDWKLYPGSSEEYVGSPERLRPTAAGMQYARRVSSFDAPEAKAWGQAADSEAFLKLHHDRPFGPNPAFAGVPAPQAKINVAPSPLPLYVAPKQMRTISPGLIELESRAKAATAAREAFEQAAAKGKSLEPYLALKAANSFGVPQEDVLHFGRMMTDALEEALARKKAAGGVLFRATPRQPRGFAPMTEERHAEARLLAERNLRRETTRQFLSDAFASDSVRRYQVPGALLKKGTDVQLVQDAALHEMERQAVVTGIAKPVIGGVTLPGHVIILRQKVFNQVLWDRQVPVAVYDKLVEGARMAGRGETQAGRTLPAWRTNTQKFVEGFEQLWSRLAVGPQKTAFMTMIRAQGKNIVGNHFIAAFKTWEFGLPPGALEAELGRARRDVARYRATGQMNADMRRMGPVFQRTLSDLATPGASRSPQALAGMAGKVVNGKYVPGAAERAVNAATAGLQFQQDMERTYKLGLQRALQRKVGASRAVTEVRRALYDYSDRPAPLAALDKWGFWIFNAWPVKSYQLALHTLATRPDLLAQLHRARQGVFANAPGSLQDYQNLQPHQRSVGTFPMYLDTNTGHWMFWNPGAAFPLTAPLDTAREAAQSLKAGRLPQVLPTLSQAFNAGIGATEAQRYANRKGYADQDQVAQIAKDGASPNLQARARTQFSWTGHLPQVGLVQQLRDFASGMPRSDYRTAEPESLGQFALRHGLGVSTFSGEPQAAADQRMRGQYRERAHLAAAFAKTVVAGYKAQHALDQLAVNPRAAAAYSPEAIAKLKQQATPNPYTGSAALEKITNAKAANTERAKAQGFLDTKILQSPRVLTGKGVLVDEESIRDQVAWIFALAGRARELGAKERTQRQ